MYGYQILLVHLVEIEACTYAIESVESLSSLPFFSEHHCCCVVAEVMKKVFVAKLEIVLLVLRQGARTGLAIFFRSFGCISIVAFCAKFTLGSSSIIFAVLTRQKEMISQAQAMPCHDAFLLGTNNAGTTTLYTRSDNVYLLPSYTTSSTHNVQKLLKNSMHKKVHTGCSIKFQIRTKIRTRI